MKKPRVELFNFDLPHFSSLASTFCSEFCEFNFSWNYLDPVFLHSVIVGGAKLRSSWGTLIMADVSFP